MLAGLSTLYIFQNAADFCANPAGGNDCTSPTRALRFGI